MAVVRDGGENVALLPFQQCHIGMGAAIALGISDAQGLICSPGLEVQPEGLVRSCGLGVYQFDHLVVRLDRLSPWTREVANAPVMDVRDGYEAYLREGDRESHRLFGSLMQKRRKLRREHGELEFRFASTNEQDLATLMKWKSEQWDHRGRFDRFARPWIREVVRLLARSDGTACRGTLSTLSAGGRLVAAHFGIRTATRLSLWFPAYDSSFARYSPGLLLFFGMAEAAPDHGVGILDLGKGTEAYKQSLTSWTYPVASGRVPAGRLADVACRVKVGSTRRFDSFLVNHENLRAHLPDRLSHVDRVR